MTLTQGDKFPQNVTFNYLPINLADPADDTCKIPSKLSIDTLIKQNPKSHILIVSVPGAFTPLCSENHIPPYLESLAQNTSKLAKNVAAIIVIGANDQFVMQAWGNQLCQKFLNLAQNANSLQVIFANDAGFSKLHGLSMTDPTGFVRNKRYAVLVNCENSQVDYFGAETERVVDKSGVDAILAKL